MLRIISLATLSLLCLACARVTPSAQTKYAIVASQATRADQNWEAVIQALQNKHRGIVIEYRLEVRDAALELALAQPDYIAFVAPPKEAGRAFVVDVHRLTRELDDDPYTDAIWGIVTGYEAADALRIATETKPLLITRGASGMGGQGSLKPFDSGFACNEGQQFKFHVKKAGQIETLEVKPDAVQAMVEGFNRDQPQCFITSGHATTRDWQLGYKFKGGQFRNDKGQLYGLSVKGQRFDINSPNPKVYLPVGNCLIGQIPKADCMATALMRSAGVRQMFGYTVVTWFGFGGWGVRTYFFGQAGRFSFAQAAYFNHQALLHQLATKHSRFADLSIPGYDQRRLNGTMNTMASRYMMVRKNSSGKAELDRDAIGLLWDRDTVAFYGDPAWEARMSKAENGLAWRQAFTEKQGTYTFTVQALRDGTWPKRPIAAMLPKRLTDIAIIAGQEHQATISDNFILVPLRGKFTKADRIAIAFRGAPLPAPPADRLEIIAAAVKPLDDRTQDAVRYALARAGSNRGALLGALKAASGDRLKAVAFLIANMPRRDLRSLTTEFLLEHVAQALEARAKAPWGKLVPEEVFLNDVLPYAALNEKREVAWRKDFYRRFAAKAHACKTPGEAAVTLNRTIYDELNVKYHATKRPKPDQSPAESIAANYASCTGLSILLIDACRAVGIPARAAGIASWKVANTDAQGRHGGNHTWVEVWDGGKWHFLDAAGSKALDKAWFTKKAAKASDPKSWRHRIHATSFRPTGVSYPLVWALHDATVPAIDVTANYTAPNQP